MSPSVAPNATGKREQSLGRRKHLSLGFNAITALSTKLDMKCVSSTPVSEYALGMRSYFPIALACAFAAFSVLVQPAIGAEADSKIQDIAETIQSAVEAAADMPKLIQSAEAGDVKSQMTLGVLYDYGLGVPQDKEEAFKWFRKAAEQGNFAAQFFMGRHYEDGDGVLQDFVQAHAWFNVASANGSVGASELRDEVANQMTPEQIAKAQELAREYFEKYQPKK